MNVPAVYLPEAEDDIVEARAHYESHNPGLGDQFLQAVQDQVDRIRINPKLYGFVRGKIRAALLHGFPYIVYYRDRYTDILVIAVQHGKRSIRVWRKRV